MYQHFIFDLYGTLLDIRTDERSNATWTAFAAWMDGHGMHASPRSLRQRFQCGVKKLAAALSPHSFPEFDLAPLFADMCRRLRPDASDALCREAGEAFRCCSTRLLALYPNTLHVLRTLREAGKSVYLLSNAQRIFTWRELEETGLLPYFDDVLISSDFGCKKPDPAFFRALLDKHGLAPEDCVMIGNDSTLDIAGAAAVGMDAMYLRTAISPANDPTPDCRFVFEDGEILHVLALLGGGE